MSLPASDLTKKPDMRTTMELGAVLPETAEVRDDHLFIGGVDMVELARKEGTALYVFDEADLRHRMETYREAFRSRYENSDIIYASKAFLNKEVLRIAEAEALTWPGVYYVRTWLNEGRCEVGDSLMYVLIGADIRPNCIDALQKLVGHIKNELVVEKEIFA